jgi:hypothetical protein
VAADTGGERTRSCLRHRGRSRRISGGGAAGQQARASRLFAPRCFTCVLRAGNPMRLEPGRLAGLVGDNLACGAALICHTTLYGQRPDLGEVL